MINYISYRHIEMGMLEDRMQTNILEYLEKTTKEVPDKIAFADDVTELSFKEFTSRAKKVGTILIEKGSKKDPVIIYMKKTPDLIAAFFGVVYSGGYYVPIDEEMPSRRIDLILQNTRAKFLICDEEMYEEAKRINFSGEIILYRDCLNVDEDINSLRRVREIAIDMDPVYAFYTSGSTGVPKGVVGCHRGIIDYTEHLGEILNFDRECIFANQTPLYWDASMKEIYATLKYGATTYIVPKKYFMFPVKLVEYLNEHKVNTICWVVSALTMISSFGTFDTVKPNYLKTVTFCGEVFPVKQFNIWKSTLPEVEFYNLYGPTETTGVSTYYHADRIFGEDEVIPIGKAFKNTEIFLLNQDGKEAKEGEVGELCIRGAAVTLGYLNSMDKTNEVFVQNPLVDGYLDLIYKTGDMAIKDADGNFVFASRKDHQIKHMGHRIELGEIESDVNLVDNIGNCCCIFVKEKNKIVLFYTGTIEKSELTKELKKRLPRYMLPNSIVNIEKIPLTLNGKMDRIEMEKIFMSMGRNKRKKEG